MTRWSRMSPMLGLTLIALVTCGAARMPLAAAADGVGEKVLLDNQRLMMIEYVFAAGFRGEEHAAVADEFAYVLDGQFTVVTRGRGRRVVRKGEIEYARKGTIHYSLNETKKPARVLVVIVKER